VNMPPGAALVLFVFGILFWLKHETRKRTHTYIYTILIIIILLLLLNFKLVRVRTAVGIMTLLFFLPYSIQYVCPY
jgi:hypothetical protein